MQEQTVKTLWLPRILTKSPEELDALLERLERLRPELTDAPATGVE